MKKILTAKIQQLNPRIEQFAPAFAKCLIVEPESKELLLKKGTLYSVFEITGTANFDTSLSERVLKDVLHNSYYQSDNISPIQSLEKAIMEAKEKVLQLSNDTLTSEPTNIQLNISAGILWGNVFYAVTFGEAEGYLMREGIVKPIEAVSEGAFSSASGIVKDEDVIILCSKQFSKTFPPQKLLTSKISEADLSYDSACVLLKFVVDTSFSEEEVIDFGLQKEAGKTRKRERVQKLILGARAGIEKATPAVKKVLSIFKQKNKKTATDLSGLNKKNEKKIFSLKKSYLLIATGVLLSGALVLQFAKRNKTENDAEIIPASSSENQPITENSAPSKEDFSDITKDDGLYKVLRKDPEVFYDIKITDPSAEPKELAVVGDYLISNDPSSGKIFVSNVETAKFTEETEKFPSLKLLINYKGTLGFVSGSKVYSYSPKESKVINSWDIPSSVSSLGTYSGYIYTINQDQLTRYEEDGTSLSGTLWGQNSDYVNARSMTVAYSIYLITSTGDITKYTSGNKNTFEIKGLDKDLKGAVKIITDIDFDYIYVLDTANQRAVVVDPEGNLVKQYTHTPGSSWENLKDMAVTTDESTMFLLTGSKILKISLEEQ